MAEKHVEGIVIAKNWLAPLASFAVIFAVWEASVRIFQVPEYLLPAPSAIACELTQDLPELFGHATTTAVEALLGFIIANVIGVLVGVAFAQSRSLERSFYPLAIALKTTPIVAMAPLLVLWFGTGIWSKVAAAALVSFFPSIVSTTKGLTSISQDALDLFKSFSATRWQVFTKLSFPTALPHIFSALKISSSLSVVGAIVGEFVGAKSGIGFTILISSYHLETVKMFSALFLSALLGMIFFGVVSLLEKKLVFWSTAADT